MVWSILATNTIKISYTEMVDCLKNMTASNSAKPGHCSKGRSLLGFLKNNKDIVSYAC